MMEKSETQKQLEISVRESVAKLLSTENLHVEHANVPTASIDLENRILYLPNWDNVSHDLYLMLTAHEVGHAIYTPTDSWIEQIKVNRHLKDVINIVEDARIEKLIQLKYPGTRRSFVSGYKELFYKHNKGNLNDIENQPLIERLNLHFKLGKYGDVKIPFSEQEQIWVTKIDQCKSFGDVVAVSKELYEDWEKSQDKNNPEDSKQSDEAGGESDDDSSQQSPDGNITVMTKDEFKKLMEEAKNNPDPSGEVFGCHDMTKDQDIFGDKNEDESKQDSTEGDSSEAESKESEASKDSTEGGNSPKKILVVDSQEQISKVIESLASSNEYNVPVYVNLPTLKGDEHIIDYKIVHEEILEYYNCVSHGPAQLAAAEESYNNFRAANKNVVNNMASIFEMKKRAKQEYRAKTSKTGVINLNKIHSYKYNEDVFKKITSVPDGKSHGLIMYIDLSGSMQGNMKGTYEQTLNLVMFCKRVGIPFEVYGFTDAYTRPRNSYYPAEPGDMAFTQNTVLRNYFSSRMNSIEFRQATINIMAIISCYSPDTPRDVTSTVPPQDVLGNTPLNFAVATTISICNNFKKKNNLDIVNVIYLTDGAATDAVEIIRAKSSHKTRVSREGNYVEPLATKVIFRDKASKKTWKTKVRTQSKNDITKELLSIVRELCGVNVICFYIAPKYEITQLFRTRRRSEYDKFKLDGCYYQQNVNGYSHHYIIKGGKELSVSNGEFGTLDTDSKRDIFKKYSRSLEGAIMSRTLVNKFIDNIA